LLLPPPLMLPPRQMFDNAFAAVATIAIS